MAPPSQLQQIIDSLRQQVGYAASQARQAMDEVAQTKGEHARLVQDLLRQQRDISNLNQALASVKAGGAKGPGMSPNDHVLYIENIPGRRVPFDMLVDIPIGANVTSQQQGTITISQDGPFVAVARYATFQSALRFTKTDPTTGASAQFLGRTFGRQRPVHSVADYQDAVAGVFSPVAGIAFPGTGAPIFASPSSMSGFRSMEFDGDVIMMNQGSAYPRSNIRVPSAFYMAEVNTPFQLGALDFFERGETIQWQVTPLHANNPSAGNLSGFTAGGIFPFIDAGYDPQEGINDALNPVATADPVQRLPEGILRIGLHGFRIIMPPGPVRMT